MKAKLLKKVRRRYEIIRYDSITPSSKRSLVRCSKEHGFPVYKIIDKEDQFSILTTYCQFKENAIMYVLELIRIEYGHLTTHKEIKEKVWYKQSNNKQNETTTL